MRYLPKLQTQQIIAIFQYPYDDQMANPDQKKTRLSAVIGLPQVTLYLLGFGISKRLLEILPHNQFYK